MGPLLLLLSLFVLLVSSIQIGVDHTSCAAQGRFSPLNTAKQEVLDLARIAAQKAGDLAQANAPTAWLNNLFITPEQFRVYKIFQTFFPLNGHDLMTGDPHPLSQNQIQQIADRFITFNDNLNNPNFGPGTIQIFCGDAHIVRRQTGQDAHGQPIFSYFDTDKLPEVELVNFQPCSQMPNTNAYAFNGGSDIIICDFAWQRRKMVGNQALYIITGFKNNPHLIAANDPLDDYSLITGTLAHELFHTYMGFHNDHQINVGGQMVSAYGTVGCMTLSIQNPLVTIDNCESIMLAAIAMFLDGWSWHTGVATV